MKPLTLGNRWKEGSKRHKATSDVEYDAMGQDCIRPRGPLAVLHVCNVSTFIVGLRVRVRPS